MKNVFGPVPSRRLGRSLGIDVIPPKTCSYDCVYCESGPTTKLTFKRQAFVAPDQVIHQLEDYFRKFPGSADALTFSSAGEPTLYEPLGELLRDIKKRFSSIPLMVLTNGSLLWDPAVRRDLLIADRVVPSLDAVTRDIFLKVNRPHPALDLSAIVEGIEAFRREYRGQLHVEVVLVSGMNDHADELVRIAQAIDRISPDRIELNTIVRPPAAPDVLGLCMEEMQKASAFFPRTRTQIIGRFQAAACSAKDSALDERILELVRRRPCTAAEMALSLGVEMALLEETLATLLETNRIGRYLFDNRDYWCIP
jgi:wyosine [tRNA(Phe)-imidazoG37] synthetase (radical SAM superfamily)